MNRRAVPEDHSDLLSSVQVVEEPPQLAIRIGEILILGQNDLLFFDGPHPALCLPILLRLSDRRHADRHTVAGQEVCFRRGAGLHTLLGMVDFVEAAPSRRPPRGRQGKTLIESTA